MPQPKSMMNECKSQLSSAGWGVDLLKQKNIVRGLGRWFCSKNKWQSPPKGVGRKISSKEGATEKRLQNSKKAPKIALLSLYLLYLHTMYKIPVPAADAHVSTSQPLWQTGSGRFNNVLATRLEKRIEIPKSIVLEIKSRTHR